MLKGADGNLAAGKKTGLDGLSRILGNLPTARADSGDPEHVTNDGKLLRRWRDACNANTHPYCPETKSELAVDLRSRAVVSRGSGKTIRPVARSSENGFKRS